MQIKTDENQVIHVNSSARERAREREGHKDKKEHKSSIYAGDLGLQDDLFTMKKKHAQKKALKMINDAWGVDRKIDQSIEEIRGKLDLLQDEFDGYQDAIAEGNAEKESLREEYGVEKDSQEQKDLELLEKQADSRRMGNGPEGVQLTEEEEKRLAELEDKPLTDYQKRCMEIDKEQEIYENKAAGIERQIEGGNASIRGIKLERLKEVPPMVKARRNADKILKEANKEAISLLTGEAKEHIDKTYEEIEEKAEEKAEEKEKQEEKLENIKKEKEELEKRTDAAQIKNSEAEEVRREQQEQSREDKELLEGMTDSGKSRSDSVSDAQAEIKALLEKMKLLEDDLKGTSVDEEL